MKHVEYFLFLLAGSGLRVKTPCTSTSDTVCEPLERFYCVSYEKDSCGRAQEHRHCKPGQYIRQNGRVVFLNMRSSGKHLLVIFILVKVDRHE